MASKTVRVDATELVPGKVLALDPEWSIMLDDGFARGRGSVAGIIRDTDGMSYCLRGETTHFRLYA